MKLLLAMILSFSVSAQGAELLNVKFDDKINVEGQDLVLNGLGIRRALVIGFPVKVYVAGLYLKEKNNDGNAILKSEGLKYIKMNFKRSVDKEKVQNGWSEAFAVNCYLECDKMQEHLRKFNKAMTDMKRNSTVEVFYFADRVKVVSKGKFDRSDTIENANFSKNLLAVFVGDKVEDRRLRNGLLGNGDVNDKD